MRPLVATEQLRHSISSGQFPPGQKLNETDLAATLGISRNTLRESFATLTSQGILTYIPNRGVFISSPTLSQMRDIYISRAHLEPAALLWGAHLDAAALDTIVSTAEAALAADDFRAVADANQLFHRQVVQASGSDISNEFMSRILALMRLAFLGISEHMPDFHAEFVAQNRHVADLVAANDRPRAADTLRSYLLETRERLASFLTEDPVYGA